MNNDIPTVYSNIDKSIPKIYKIIGNNTCILENGFIKDYYTITFINNNILKSCNCLGFSNRYYCYHVNMSTAIDENNIMYLLFFNKSKRIYNILIYDDLCSNKNKIKELYDMIINDKNIFILNKFIETNSKFNNNLELNNNTVYKNNAQYSKFIIELIKYIEEQ